MDAIQEAALKARIKLLEGRVDMLRSAFDKLWHRLYPYITGVRLVPEGERSVST